MGRSQRNLLTLRTQWEEGATPKAEGAMIFACEDWNKEHFVTVFYLYLHTLVIYNIPGITDLTFLWQHPTLAGWLNDGDWACIDC